jgi:hypothetical protein
VRVERDLDTQFRARLVSNLLNSQRASEAHRRSGTLPSWPASPSRRSRAERLHEADQIGLPHRGVIMGEMPVRLIAVRDQHVAPSWIAFISRSTVPSSGGLASRASPVPLEPSGALMAISTTC